MHIASSIYPDLFTSSQQQSLQLLLNGCSHRQEFKQLLRNLHNEEANPNSRLWSLLRYADPEQREGLFALLEAIGSGKGIEQIFTSDFLNEMMH